MDETASVKEALDGDEPQQCVKPRLRHLKHQKLGPSRCPSPLRVNLQLRGTEEQDDRRW